jgi:hypothetical protein
MTAPLMLYSRLYLGRICRLLPSLGPDWLLKANEPTRELIRRALEKILQSGDSTKSFAARSRLSQPALTVYCV